MTLFDDDPKRPPTEHAIGQDLSRLSADELRNRIALLEGEIRRLQDELSSKGATRAAAEAFFRR